MKKNLKGVRILIVEDEASLNEAYVTILKAEGVEVDSCFNGQEALAAIAKHQPELILLDLRMPKMDGIEFLQNFASQKNRDQTKVIIFSNYDEQSEIDSAFSFGANRYMLKSWASPKELIKVIKETL